MFLSFLFCLKSFTKSVDFIIYYVIIELSKERKHDVEDDRWCWFNSHPLEYNPIERKQT